MSLSSIRTKPSIDEPSNMISPSSALANWLLGTSTFLLTPRMSVNWRRRKSTSKRRASASTSAWVADARSAGKSFSGGREEGMVRRSYAPPLRPAKPASGLLFPAMTATTTPRPCPACGTPGTGSFCSTCGAPVGARTCRTCQAELSAQARFCHRCGTAAPGGGSGGPGSAPRVPGARSETTAWTIAGLLVLALFAMIAYKVLTGSTATRAPDMANAGNAAPGSPGGAGVDPGGSLATGPAPDISAMTPAERFIRLNNRVMEAAGRGDSATVVNFTPMALGAYA